jgi:hypothetical protein
MQTQEEKPISEFNRGAQLVKLAQIIESDLVIMSQAQTSEAIHSARIKVRKASREFRHLFHGGVTISEWKEMTESEQDIFMKGGWSALVPVQFNERAQYLMELDPLLRLSGDGRI